MSFQDRHRRRTGRTAPRPAVEPRTPAEPEPDLLLQLRSGLRADGPAELLMLMSGIVELTDTHDPDVPELRDVVESFAGTPFAETTAALHVLRVLCGGDAVRADIERTLRGRRHPMPPWLARLDEARLSGDVLRLVHVLGDGDDYLFGVRFADGSEITVLVYVDFNLNGAVKDAFVIPDTLRTVSGEMVGLLDPEQRLEVADAADARALVEQAIAFGAAFEPPIESETWPVQRPLVEWAVRLLPGGGTAPEVEPVSEDRLDEAVDSLFGSPEGVGLHGAQDRDLARTAFRFAADYAGGDPWRWSPVVVEMVLSWVPDRVLADEAYLARFPGVLTALVSHAHRVTGVPGHLTRETTEAVAGFAPRYLEEIDDTTRALNPALGPVLDALGLDSPADLAGLSRADLEAAFAAGPYGGEPLRDALASSVGGTAALEALDDDPLPDEPFDRSLVPADVQDRVDEWLEWCDRCADALFDVELRTAFRRFLARAASADPAIFRRAGSVTRGAAALVWACGRANGAVGPGTALPSKDLLAWFGLVGSVSQRAEPLMRAIGADPWGPDLGSADLLVSSTRRRLLALRRELR